MGNSLLVMWSALIANVVAQSIKPIITYLKTGNFTPRQAFASGGFPSSHTSTVSALTLAVGIEQGFNSTIFAVTMIFSFIVMYDAMNVRYFAGKNIELTKQLIEDLRNSELLNTTSPIYDEKLKIVLGHKKIEAIGGLILGCIITLMMYLIVGF